MMDYSDFMQCEDTLDLVIWEEWEAYTNEINMINEANRRLCEIWVEEAGLSFPKIEDRCCPNSQRQRNGTLDKIKFREYNVDVYVRGIA